MNFETVNKLPAAFLERMRALLPNDFDAFLASYHQEPQRGLRINPLKCTERTVSQLSEFPLRPTGFEPLGYYLDRTEVGTGNHPLHHAGAFYLQEPAAMIPAASAYIAEGDYVLDVCAAPGGKSTQLAARIGCTGMLVANEFVPARAKILLSNIERLGIQNAIVTNTDAAHLAEWYPECFDCVLVDAPCSGEGMFRKNPDAIAEWSEETVAMCAARSYDILSAAECCLRPGGTLIYSTCTFAAEENELLIAHFLSTHPDYTIEPLPASVQAITTPGIALTECREDLTRTARCYPHITGGEGQYVCVMRRAGDAERRAIPVGKYSERLTRDEQRAIDALFGELFDKDLRPTVIKYRGLLYAIPAHLQVSGSCFSLGARIGEFKGSRIAPHHHLFSAWGSTMRRTWCFAHDDPRVLRYLHGETIQITDADTVGEAGDGFGCVTVDGCPLGGAKRVGDVLKNHYPKGLRIQGV